MARKIRVTAQWTATAKECLKKLPAKVRKGILGKVDELLETDDPRKHCKALTGPLSGCYRIVYSRYRLIFSVEEESIKNGGVILHLKMRLVAAGIRKERDKNDVYRIAERLMKLMIHDDDSSGDTADTSD